MSFKSNVSLAMSKYSVLHGRSSRREFWCFAAIFILVNIAAVVFDFFFWGSPALSMVVFLGFLLPFVCVSVRRFHDIGRSGRWLVLYLVPILGALAVLVMSALPGVEQGNRYGPKPF
ncbi:DUF805 domain-containing protein [Martelella alba]|uniref:DUF805 domain-containing protein n=1 Tax=Martelella alba TaxID=2590451 RepID=A0A506U2L0_9HYPH|nr:DUF805 domain-containing protein [Martelella alba]TPW27511.1 DUF805 domain-containing protein [Martelella alba]